MGDSVCVLQCKQGIYKGQRFEFLSGDIIGRFDECRIVLKDQMTSRLHCMLLFVQESWWVICFGLNGMVIDGRRFSASQEMIPIKRGSVLEINKDTFIVL